MSLSALILKGIKAPAPTPSIRLLFARGIFTVQIYNVLKPVSDPYLGQYVQYAFILHYSWETWRYSDLLLPSPNLHKKCVCVTFLVVMAKGLLENAKHISPQTDLWLVKWVHMRPVKHQFQTAGGRCTAGASRAETQQLLWSTVWGNEGKKSR